MRITADNRGRIALSKVWPSTRSKEEPTFGLPYSDWDVTVDKGQVVLTPAGEEPKAEWGFHTRLTPEMIGKTVRIQGVTHGQPSGHIYVPENNDIPEISGVLEAYSTLPGAEWVKLRGYTGLIPLDVVTQKGNRYGSAIYFGLRG